MGTLELINGATIKSKNILMDERGKFAVLFIGLK